MPIRRPLLLPVAVLALGLAAVVLLFAAEQVRHRAVDDDVAILQALGDIEKRLAIAHLWTEEFVGGDEVPLGEVHDGLEAASAAVAAMLGAAVSPGPEDVQDLPVVSDPAVLARLGRLSTRLVRFREVTGSRLRSYEEGLAVGVGTPVDVEYDRLFAELLAETRELRDLVEISKLRDEALATRRLLAILAVWFGVVAGAAVALWSRELHRQRAEAALSASQRQLLESQKMDAVGRLAGGLAHDINNYLAAIRGNCELVLMRSEVDPAVGRKMEAAVRIVEKASALLQRLLAFARRQPMKPEVVSLNRVVLGMERVLRSTLGETVALHHRLAPDAGNVRADVSQLEQVLVNLVVNAGDAMPGGGTLTLGTHQARRSGPDGERRFAALTVADTGHGIPSDLRDRIFEPFVSSKGGHNSGLGLAVVYGVVQQHGGEIEVESEVWSGTLFRILLPRCDEEETVSEAPVQAAPDAPRGSERVLLVDDNDEFRTAAAALLSELGYEVAVAASGEEALERVATGEVAPDVVIADLVLPGMDGRELVERLRRLRPTPALLTSGYGESTIAGHGTDLPLLRKHFSADELGRALRRVLDGKAAG